MFTETYYDELTLDIQHSVAGFYNKRSQCFFLSCVSKWKYTNPSKKARHQLKVEAFVKI